MSFRIGPILPFPLLRPELRGILLPGSEAPAEMHLPVVQDINAAIWPDRIASDIYWYAPALEVVQPKPNEDAPTSPFWFTFERSGFTSSGNPGLTGTVRSTLKKTKSPETLSALERLGNVNSKPIPVSNISVSLAVPFIDENDGLTKKHLFTASIEEVNDTIIATVKLVNEWVQLCYGALSQPEFQKESASVEISYTFEAYIKDRSVTSFPSFIETVDPIPRPVVDPRPVIDPHPVIDPGPVDMIRSHIAHPVGMTTSVHIAHPVGITTSVHIAHPVHMIRNHIINPGVIVANPVPDTSENYIKTVCSKHTSVEVLYPCTTLGTFYRESTRDGTMIVGCLDSFQLGRINYSMYKQINDVDFQDPMYNVYQSLQQPEKFLIVPNFYRIGRYDSSRGEPLAYCPEILFQSIINKDNPANNFFAFHMTLTPDLPPYVRKKLELKLLSKAKAPIIEYPTQVATEYQLKVQDINLTASHVFESFKVTMTIDLTHAIALREMMQKFASYGTAQFKLADGMILKSTLILELDNITGPWRTGPIEVTLENSGIQLTNKIEHIIEISKLMIYHGVENRGEIEVNTPLDSGKSHFVTLSDTQGIEVYPVYSFPHSSPAVLEELRSFVEDTHTTIEFIDLVNHNNHEIKILEVKVRIKGLDKIFQVPMAGSPAKGLVDIIFPLTQDYYQKNIIEFQVTKTFNSGEISSTQWRDWYLTTEGNIVSITWDMIQ